MDCIWILLQRKSPIHHRHINAQRAARNLSHQPKQANRMQCLRNAHAQHHRCRTGGRQTERLLCLCADLLGRRPIAEAGRIACRDAQQIAGVRRQIIDEIRNACAVREKSPVVQSNRQPSYIIAKCQANPQTILKAQIQTSCVIPFAAVLPILGHRDDLEPVSVDVHRMACLRRANRTDIHVERVRTVAAQLHLFRFLRLDALLQRYRTVQSAQRVGRMATIIAERFRIVHNHLIPNWRAIVATRRCGIIVC